MKRWYSGLGLLLLILMVLMCGCGSKSTKTESEKKNKIEKETTTEEEAENPDVNPEYVGTYASLDGIVFSFHANGRAEAMFPSSEKVRGDWKYDAGLVTMSDRKGEESFYFNTRRKNDSGLFSLQTTLQDFSEQALLKVSDNDEKLSENTYSQIMESAVFIIEELPEKEALPNISLENSTRIERAGIEFLIPQCFQHNIENDNEDVFMYVDPNDGSKYMIHFTYTTASSSEAGVSLNEMKYIFAHHFWETQSGMDNVRILSSQDSTVAGFDAHMVTMYLDFSEDKIPSYMRSVSVFNSDDLVLIVSAMQTANSKYDMFEVFDRILKSSVSDNDKNKDIEETKGENIGTDNEPETSQGVGYEGIYNEYSQKLKEATPKLIEEYRTEAKNNTKGLEGLAELSNSKVEKLAEISTEGTEKMAEYMFIGGSGKYSEYQDWAMKLNSVYMEEAGKITSEYLNSAY